MDLAAISFSAERDHVLPWTSTACPLRNSISWMDNRAVEQAEYLTAKYGDEVCYQHTGQISFAANWPVAKALWVKQNEPEVFPQDQEDSADRGLYHLPVTGRYVSDCAMLCSTLYWDITNQEGLAAHAR